ncbi:MAG: invasion associated locus B family protein [Alphaproteobacteria bacterium]|nr:invasion associated locus B family protein [Alphaproteobacteria bacterium]MBU0858778.1 invasion associated locus B family protein [Alphaproteobacteria bacterium]
MKYLLFVFLLLLAVPASAQDKAVTSGTQYDSWMIRCEGEGTARQCETFQRLTRAATGERMIEFALGFTSIEKLRGQSIAPSSVAAAKTEAARAVIVLPLGILLPDGVTLLIDNKHRFAFQIRYCTPDGCYATLNLNRGAQDQLTRGFNAAITFRTMDSQDISLPIDLKGLGSALQAIR